ncbi:hypothetical protein SAMN05421676_101255 [Salinibacillus kushneri]|uniref:DUF8042 domain-containing protein n=1 Tax=Salinibacillus kushneri TaxID=237682 RepID=A0A1H9YQ86_9BACI|nr:hypothetical protein SAMN05421676_101255 [Salinibacillus kushneri]
MANLDVQQVEFLQKYHELLEGMSEALEHLDKMTDVNESDIAETLFADLVKGMQQLHASHDQLVPLLNIETLNQFDYLVQSMSKWFENDVDKATLLSDEVIPAFLEWKKVMDHRIEPFISH